MAMAISWNKVVQLYLKEEKIYLPPCLILMVAIAQKAMITVKALIVMIAFMVAVAMIAFMAWVVMTKYSDKLVMMLYMEMKAMMN